MDLISVSKELREEVQLLDFSPPTEFCYNPLDYAWNPHAAYLESFGSSEKEVLLVGMNPGPFGMAQTGVPFGDVVFVRDWLGISGDVSKPKDEHPKRRIEGFSCPRREVSGSRLWGWAEKRFASPDKFFSKFFVWNYCPLCFMEESGRNRTPDKLPAEEREALFEICGRALEQVVGVLKPKFVIGVGKFAEKQAKEALSGQDVTIDTILHPSPASPAANKGWAEAAEKKLGAMGILG